MKDEFIEYLGTIGILEPICKRIETIYEFYKQICPDEITGIFVSEFIKEDGSREYENLWFFSENFFMEAKQFVINDDFDITPTHKRIHYLRMHKQNYDLIKATEKSRMLLSLSLDTGIIGNLKASKENCDKLRDINFKYFVANLKK